MKFHGLEINDPKWIKAYWWIRISITLLLMSLFTVLPLLITGASLNDPDLIPFYMVTLVIFVPVTWFISGLEYGSLWMYTTEEGKEYAKKLMEEARIKKIRKEIEKQNRRGRFYSDISKAFWFGIGFGGGDIFSDGHGDGAS